MNEYDDSRPCPRCGCCDTETVDCEACWGEGGWNPYEDDPLWYDPDDFELCETCDGVGCYAVCAGWCDIPGAHAVKGAPSQRTQTAPAVGVPAGRV